MSGVAAVCRCIEYRDRPNRADTRGSITLCYLLYERHVPLLNERVPAVTLCSPVVT